MAPVLCRLMQRRNVRIICNMKMIVPENNTEMEACAGMIIDTIPKMMAAMRRQLHHLAPDLSVPRFRALVFLRQQPAESRE